MNTPFVLAIRIGEFKKYRYKRHIKINAKSKNIGKISKIQIYTHQILKRQILFEKFDWIRRNEAIYFPFYQIYLVKRGENSRDLEFEHWIAYTRTSAATYLSAHTHTHARVHNVDVLPILIRRWWLITRDDHRADRSVAFVLSDSGTTRSVTT